MNRKIQILCTSCLLVSLFTAGCQKTPSDTIVRKKSGETSYENLSAEASNSDAKINEVLKAPDTFSIDLTDPSGYLKVKADEIPVKIPNVDKMAVKKVQTLPFSQEEVSKFTDALIGDSPLYDYHDCVSKRPQSEYEEKLLELKKFKAEGNLDPYEHGIDPETGELYYDIDEMIEVFETEYANAEKKPVWNQVSKKLGENTVSNDPEEEKETGISQFSNKNFIIGAVTLDNGITYQIQIGNQGEEEKENFYQPLSEYRSYVFFKDIELNSIYMADPAVWNPALKPDPAALKITPEEAIETGNALVKKMGLNAFENVEWEYYYKSTSDDAPANDLLIALHYTRQEDGVPFSFTRQSGNALEDMDSYDEPWDFEELEILINEKGIISFSYINPNSMVETVNDNVALLSFDEIIQIFESMVQIKNADAGTDKIENSIELTDIRLSYMRVMDPDNRDTGLMIPVWDFFGTSSTYITEECTIYDGLEADERSNQDLDTMNSYLTINAIDGSIIDRSLGY